jgi:hypothetical protein
MSVLGIDNLILMGMGGLFIFLGLVSVILGKTGEKRYYDSASTRTDVREYLEHGTDLPQPGAFKIGGWIAIAVGLLMVIMGGAFWLWG